MNFTELDSSYCTSCNFYRLVCLLNCKI